MTDFYNSVLNYYKKHLEDSKKSCRTVERRNAFDEKFRSELSNKAHISFLTTVVRLLESAHIFDLSAISDIKDNIVDVKYQGNLLDNVEEIILPYDVCYFEMDGLKPFSWSGPGAKLMSDKSGVIAWQTDFRTLSTHLEEWGDYDLKEETNRQMLSSQTNFIGSDRVILLLSVALSPASNSLPVDKDVYIIGGAGCLLINGSNPTTMATIPSFTEEAKSILGIDIKLRNLLCFCLLTLRPHEYDELIIDSKLEDEIEVTYNSMYLDNGFNSYAFRCLYGSGDEISEELNKLQNENGQIDLEALSKLSPYGYTTAIISDALEHIRSSGYSADSLKKELLKINPSINKDEMEFILELIMENAEGDYINYDMKRVIDGFVMSEAIRSDLEIWKVFTIWMSYMLQNQKVELKNRYSKTFLKSNNIKKNSAKARSHFIVISDTKRSIDSDYVSSGIGSPKCTHTRRGHVRQYKSGKKINIAPMVINGHLSPEISKPVYKVVI